MASHKNEYCGACGNCTLHCPCPGGPTDSFREALRRWDAGQGSEANPGQLCQDADDREASEEAGR